MRSLVYHQTLAALRFSDGHMSPRPGGEYLTSIRREAGHMGSDWDDEQLLAVLRTAVRAREAVPSEWIEMARATYAWHTIDAELAELTRDSAAGLGASAPVRSEAAAIRSLTFSSAHLTIELEVTDEGLFGQILPPREGTIEVQTQAGPAGTARVDVTGCFCVEPVPAGRFRLHCRTTDSIDAATVWVTL
jgi:hypothetical protein